MGGNPSFGSSGSPSAGIAAPGRLGKGSPLGNGGNPSFGRSGRFAGSGGLLSGITVVFISRESIRFQTGAQASSPAEIGNRDGCAPVKNIGGQAQYALPAFNSSSHEPHCPCEAARDADRKAGDRCGSSAVAVIVMPPPP